MLLKRFKVPKLHTADVAGEEFVGRETSAVILFAMLDVGRAVPVALAALLADERLVVAGRLRRVLQRGVALQQPRGRERGQAHAAAAPLRQRVAPVVQHAVVAEVAAQAARLQRQQRRPQRQRARRARPARPARPPARQLHAHLQALTAPLQRVGGSIFDIRLNERTLL